MNESIKEKQPAKSRLPEYAIYKPNARGTGGMLNFQLNREKGAVFVDAANQSTEKHFDWEKRITMKWGVSDIGTVLAVLEKRAPAAKLFHKTEKSNSAFDLTAESKPDFPPYFIHMSHQDAASKQVKKVGIPLSHAEAAVLETLLKTAVVRLMGW